MKKLMLVLILCSITQVAIAETYYDAYGNYQGSSYEGSDGVSTIYYDNNYDPQGSSYTFENNDASDTYYYDNNMNYQGSSYDFNSNDTYGSATVNIGN